jgi:hypothetical protein
MAKHDEQNFRQIQFGGRGSKRGHLNSVSLPRGIWQHLRGTQSDAMRKGEDLRDQGT